MQGMFGNLGITFLKKALYGVLANIAGVLTAGVTHYAPVGDPVQSYIYNSVIVGGLTGLIALITRLVTYDPLKNPPKR